MALTDAQKVDIRRHCGFPVYGQEVGSNAGYRYFQAYGTLEFRMNNLTAAEEAMVITTFLANLTTLENAIPATSANLDTEQAAVWTHNKNELRDRRRLYEYTCRRLCGVMGVPPGPALGDGTLRLVV
jgi:hypothetical protein